MGEEGAEEGAPAAAEAAVEDTTTAGAHMMLSHPWVTAAAVTLYATRAMWTKFRELGLARHRKPSAQGLAKPAKGNDEDIGIGTGSEAELDDDDDDDDDGVADEVGNPPALQELIQMDGNQVRCLELSPAQL